MIIVLALLLLATTVPAGAADLITMERATEALCPSCTTLRFPIKQPTLPANTLKLEVFDVGLGARHDEPLRKAFGDDVTLETDGTGRAKAIAIKISDTALRETLARPGTYDVMLRVDTVAAGTAPTTIKLQAVRPPAKLRPIDTLIVNRGWWLPPILTVFSADTHKAPVSETKIPIVLSEADGGGLTSVKIARTGIATAGGRPVTGRLDSFRLRGQGKDAPILVDRAKGEATVEYDVAGDYPLGTTTGTLEIRASELAEPVTVKYEVRSHLEYFYILVFIVIGLLASFFLKKKLQSAIDLSESRLPGLDLLDRVNAELARRPDAAFETAVTKNVQALKDALAATNVQDIKTKTSLVQADLEAALKEFGESRQRVVAKLDALRPAVDTPWDLPAPLEPGFKTAAEKAAAASAALSSNRLEAADKALDEAAAALAVALDEQIPLWQDDVKAFLAALAAAPRGISDAIKAKLGPAVERSIALIGQARVSGRRAAPAEMATALQAITGELRAARGPLRTLERALTAEVAEARRSFAAATVPDPAALEALEATVAAFAGELSESAAAPSGALQRLPDALTKVDAAWRHAVTAQVSDAKLREALTEALVQLKYTEAAAAAAAEAAKTSPRPTRPRRLADVSWDLDGRPEVAPALPAFRTQILEEPPVPARSTVLADLGAARLWQSVLVGVLVATGGYTLYADKFIGTFADFSLIFFWAFGLDLTVDTVMKVAKKS